MLYAGQGSSQFEVPLDQRLADALRLVMGCCVKALVGRVALADESLDQRRPGHALEEQQRIPAESVADLPQPIGVARVADDAVPFLTQHLGRDRRTPQPLEGHGLLEVGTNLVLEQLARHHLVELTGHPDLVLEVDPVDRPLGSNAFLEIEGAYLRGMHRNG